MKHILCISAVIWMLSTSTVAHDRRDTHLQAAHLTVVIVGLKNNKGEVIIKLFNSREKYDRKDANPFRKLSVTINNRRAEGIFEDLPIGEYAIKLFHDENANGHHDENFLGIPKEDYAFSNNARGTFGPPDYEKAKFDVMENTTIQITISKNSYHTGGQTR